MSYNTREYKPTFITTANQLVATGKGIFHGIIISTTSTTPVGVFDAVANTGLGTLVIFKASMPEGAYTNIDATFANGLFVTNAISGSYTVLWTS